jgi:hypothetical protein
MLIVSYNLLPMHVAILVGRRDSHHEQFHETDVVLRTARRSRRNTDLPSLRTVE